MSGTLKKIGKWLLWITGISILLIILAVIFIQTETFNKFALEYTLNELNSPQQQKQNKINAESINGNILSGIRVNKGSVTVREDTLLSFNYLEIKYNLWGLLDKRILLHEVFLSEPVIIASKINSGDSVIWNFENLLSSDETDTASSEFDWDLDIENLKIENDFIRIAGDTVRPTARWKEKRTFMQFFDFEKTDILNLNVDLNAQYYKDLKSIRLKNLSFNTNSDFNLLKLQLNANIREEDTLTELWNFELLTNKSDLKIYRLYAEDFNPFGQFSYEELGEKNIETSIDIKKFNFDDLTFFVPGLNFLDSVAGVKLEAEGKYSDLNAHILQVWLPNSVINLKGKVANLHKPDSLYLDVTGENISINAKDITTVYKGKLSDFGHLGHVNAGFRYKGYLTDFSSEFTLNTSAGYAEGNFNFNSENEKYSGYVNTRALNLGKILKKNSLNSRLNIAARFEGTGFDFNRLNANIVYTVNSSRFSNYDILHSAGEIKAAGGNIGMNIRYVSSIGNVAVKGRVNVSNSNNPSYNLQGSVQKLDIAAITKNPGDKSSLNFVFDINGKGIRPENLNGEYKLNVSESSLGDIIIPPTPVDARINNAGSNSMLILATDMAEFNAEGSFRLNELIDVIMYNISQAERLAAESTGLDSAIVHSEVSFPRYNLNLKYNLVTKDSIKLNSLIKPFGIAFNGNASGEIVNNAERFSSATKMDVINFTYNDTVLAVNNLSADFVFSNSYTNTFSGMDIKLISSTDRISFGSNYFDSAVVNYSMQGRDAYMLIKAQTDTSAKVYLNGKLNFGISRINANIDSVFADYSGYQISNRDIWIFNIENANRVNFEQFNINSRNAIINISGYLSANDQSDLKITGEDLKIRDIANIINKADSSYIISAENDITGSVMLFTEFKGTMENPTLTTDVKSNTLRYKETPIGTVSAHIEYENNHANANITLQNAERKGNLVIKGDIPFQNPLSGDTLIQQPSSAPVNISLKADNFILDYFSTLVSSISTLRGVLNADLSAKGTSEDPALTGTLKIRNGGYLFPLTGMDYSFNADMSTDNFKLVLNNLRLYNEDDEARHIDLYGTLDFKDLKISEIDLSAEGDMVILDSDVEQNDLGVYGYILAGIGKPPVKITGSLDSLFVSGQLLIKEATISSIPLEGSGYNAFEDNFIYYEGNNILINDTALHKDIIKPITEEEYLKLNPFERIKYRISDDSAKETFVNLDLNVKTENHIYASIDFNNITRDRLFGELNADLDIKTVNGQLQAFGTVDVAGDSYYRFYRDFKLNESQIRFDGDIAAPILNIKGIYQSQKNNQQYGSVTTSEVEVVVTIKGNVKEPELTIALYQDGNEVTGSDAQSDAITYLLFGRFKSELTATERTAVASSLGASVGSLYASSYLSQAVREILPFIVDAQFTYTDGNAQNTDIELISDVGDARVKFGGKLLKEDKKFEVVVDYPLNKLLNLNLPETLLLEFAREEKKQNLSTNTSNILTTEVKILYKIKF